jgi:hypothetical protein
MVHASAVPSAPRLAIETVIYRSSNTQYILRTPNDEPRMELVRDDA